MGKFLIFCPIQLKFRFWLHKKRWHTSWKFQLEKASNKKVIAKKPLTNLYEMNSSGNNCVFSHRSFPLLQLLPNQRTASIKCKLLAFSDLFQNMCTGNFIWIIRTSVEVLKIKLSLVSDWFWPIVFWDTKWPPW